MKLSEDILSHNGLSWNSPDYKLIYLGIPKVASTSMRHFMQINKRGASSVFYLQDIPEDKKDYKKFTIIREPINRFVSGVYESFKRIETPQELKVLSSKGDIKEMINSYLDILEEKGFIEIHTAPQVSFFYDKDGGDFNFDRVLLFENLSNDFNEMCKDFEIDSKLEHKNNGNKSGASKAREVILSDKILHERVMRVYKEDFELYNKYKNGTE